MDLQIITRARELNQALQHFRNGQGLDNELQDAYRLTRLYRWKMGMAIYYLHRKPYGFNAGDEGYDPGNRVNQDVWYMYQYAEQDGAMTWERFCEHPNRPSRASAHKWQRLFEIYILQFGIAMDDPDLLDCSLDRLSEVVPLLKSENDAWVWIGRAATLTDLDWKLERADAERAALIKLVMGDQTSAEAPAASQEPLPDQVAFFAPVRDFTDYQVPTGYLVQGGIAKITVQPLHSQAAIHAANADAPLDVAMETMLDALIDACKGVISYCKRGAVPPSRLIESTEQLIKLMVERNNGND